MTNSTLPVSFQHSLPIRACGLNLIGPHNPGDRDDAVARAQAGNHDAFTELYVQHKGRVFSVCMRIVHDLWLAEDLTQETFLQAYRKLSSFRGDSAFTTWLHRLTVNTVLMHMRKRVLPQVSLDELVSKAPQERGGPGFGTRDLVQAGVIDRLAIDDAVSTLAPGYRNIFNLYDVQGFGHEEIASMLHCTRGSTKSQLHKARTALRGVLSASRNSGVAERTARSETGSVAPRKERSNRDTTSLSTQSNAKSLAL